MLGGFALSAQPPIPGSGGASNYKAIVSLCPVYPLSLHHLAGESDGLKKSSGRDLSRARIAA
jgi:hypothetical protein